MAAEFLLRKRTSVCPERQTHEPGRIAFGQVLQQVRIERRQGRKGAGATPRTEEVTEPDHHFASLAELADAVEAAVESKGDAEG